MNKKILIITMAFLTIMVVTVIAIYFFYYKSKSKADDSGSTQQGIRQVVNANNQFAFELYLELDKSDKENIFYSPYGISNALIMTYEGAKGRTADEISSVLHFPEINILRPNFAAIYNEINGANEAYELKTGNALWIQQNYPLFKDYKNRLKQYYVGKAVNLDFANNTEESRQTINRFIEEQTNSKIKDLLSANSLNSLTKSVLTSVIYFKGTWEWEFDKSDTRDQDFKISATNIIKTPMMYMEPGKARFNYANTEKLQILELPYKGEKISMLILLPKQGKDYDYEKREMIISDYTLNDIELSIEKLNEYRSRMREIKLESISLPKFKFDTKYVLNENLKTMGMPTAFNFDNADFSGMIDNSKKVWIDSIIHQAFVEVNEEGTEATAATEVVVVESVGSELPIFKADHPFVFIIQEKETNSILFIGKVINPTL